MESFLPPHLRLFTDSVNFCKFCYFCSCMHTCTYLISYRLNVHCRGTYKTGGIYLRAVPNYIMEHTARKLVACVLCRFNTPNKQKAKQVGKSQS